MARFIAVGKDRISLDHIIGFSLDDNGVTVWLDDAAKEIFECEDGEPLVATGMDKRHIEDYLDDGGCVE